MNIQAAATLAVDKGAAIYRDSFPNGVLVQPTQARSCLTLINHAGVATPNWQPTLNDLLADDWRVTE